MKIITKNSLVLLALGIIITITSCKKNGTGGKAEIHAMIFHGSTPIQSSTLYVKFNTQSEPSDPTTNFDLKLIGADDDNHVHVEDIRMGEYYLYAVGYDSTTKEIVKGGVATKIKWSERKKLKEVDVQVK